ncbi:MAG: polysaccharide biosynthesis/export family protein, partial [Planctomycetota bacterium]
MSLSKSNGTKDCPRTKTHKSLLPLMALLCVMATGCYVPLRSPSIPAASLPSHYRSPVRSYRPPMNLAELSLEAPQDYLLGQGDILEVSISGLSNPGPEEKTRPIRTQIMSDGVIRLPLVGSVQVNGMNLADAQDAIDRAYSDRLVKNPKASVILVEKATISIPVLGEVNEPGVQPLPKYENDIAHAIAAAGGLSDYSARVVEIHRLINPVELACYVDEALPESASLKNAGPPLQASEVEVIGEGGNQVILRVPLESGTPELILGNQTIPLAKFSRADLTLRPSDVVVVPRQADEIFFVVGPLSDNSVVNFRVSDLDRRLGNAFLLPTDRDIDVVTAVAMAGYIDPIDSPSTVTVHRSVPGCPPKLIGVDLIAARYDWKENIYIQPGDIVYLNPDAAWW